MRRRLVILVFCLALVSVVSAAPQGAEVIYQETTSRLWFRCNSTTKTATVIADQSKYKTDYVSIEDLVIPYSVTMSNASIGTQGGTESSTEFVVTAIDDEAFKEIGAATLTFAKNSQVQTLGKSAFYDAWFAGAITLPASLQRIESKALAIYSYGEKDHVTKVIIPASVDSLCLSAIVLDAVEEIQFLGATPPHCQVLTAAAGTAYNPWTQANSNNPATPKDIKITIPQGAYDAYNNCYGIGDYFSCFTGPQNPATDCPQTLQDQRPTKCMRDGILLIQRNGKCYSVTGQ